MSKARNDLFLNSFYDFREDKLYILMKDVETGEKKMTIQTKPKVNIYSLKDMRKEPEHFSEFEKIEDLQLHTVSYRWREYDIARLVGYGKFKDDVRDRNISKNDIYLDKRFFGSDLDIRDGLIMRYLDTFKKVDDDGNPIKDKDGHIVYDDVPPIRNLHNGYIDIEADIRVTANEKFAEKVYGKRPKGNPKKWFIWNHQKGKLVEDKKITERRKQPINAITYIDDKCMTCYTFALINEEYEGQKEVMADTKTFIQETKDQLVKEMDIIAANASKKEKKKIDKMWDIINNMKYVVKFYDDEATMLKRCYQLIFRGKKPDFLHAFNAEYDISQTQLRADELGIPQEDLFTDPDIGTYINFDYEDDAFSPAKKRVNFDCASEVKILDMRQVYYSLRSNKQFATNNLNDTVERESGFRKLSHAHICDNFGDFVYKGYRTFLQYNIRDVIVMMITNEVTNDVTSLVSKRFMLRTEYDRVFSAMLSVSNVFFHVSRRYGMILGNDVNKYLLSMNDDTVEMIKKADAKMDMIMEALTSEEGIDGGLCTDPNKFWERGIEIVDGIINFKAFLSMVDIDAKSMYPSISILASIARATLLGKIIAQGTYKYGMDDEKLGYDIATSLITRDPVIIGKSLLNLPSYEELANRLYKTTAKVHEFKKYGKGHIIIKEKTKLDEIHKILKDIDRIKLNDKDQQAGQYKTSHNYIVHKDQDKNRMLYNGTIINYKLEDGNIADLYDMNGEDFIYVHSGDILKGPELIDLGLDLPKTEKAIRYENANYVRHVEPKDITPMYTGGKTFDITEYKKDIYESKLTMFTLKLGDMYLDMGHRITPISTKAKQITATVHCMGDVYNVMIRQTVPTKSGNLIIEQHLVSIPYDCVRFREVS